MNKKISQFSLRPRAERKVARPRFVDLRRRREAETSGFIDILRRGMKRFSRLVQMPSWVEDIGLELVLFIVGVLTLSYMLSSLKDALKIGVVFLLACALNILISLWMLKHKLPYTKSSLSVIWAGVFLLCQVVAKSFF